MFDVNTSLIRFWEKEFKAIRPKKNKKGNRLFSPKDILTIDKIYTLVKEKGFTLEGAKKALISKEIPDESTINYESIIKRLEKIKERLNELKSTNLD